jgi:hypothetical protein
MKNNVPYNINADFFMVPSYRISPFSTRDIAKSLKIDNPDNTSIIDLLNSRYGIDYFGVVTSGGREAIEIALKDLNLNRDDVVTILTPTSNLYISGCVTKTIEKFCNWNRKISTKTAAIFIVHEFGKLYDNIEELYGLGIPIIEDYAHALMSEPQEKNKSDYLIFSFPKSMPIQYGGALLSKSKIKYDLNLSEHCCQSNYVNTVAVHFFNAFNKVSEIQKANYNYFEEKFKNVGLDTTIKYRDSEIPSVFMFDLPDTLDIKKSKLKEMIQEKGVECSYFYGMNSFFIPVNYNMEEIDLDYVFDIVISCLKENDANFKY